MSLEKISKKLVEELNATLTAELRAIGCNVGNVELRPIAIKILNTFASTIYHSGLADATKVFEKCSERFEEEIYILQQDSRRESI